MPAPYRRYLLVSDDDTILCSSNELTDIESEAQASVDDGIAAASLSVYEETHTISVKSKASLIPKSTRRKNA